MRDPTDLDEVIYAEVVRLFERYWIPGQPVRLLGVGVRNLSGDTRQLKLWDEEIEKKERLQEAVDSLRKRFGERAVRSCRAMMRGDI